jgi:hypothetical protein
MAHDEEVEDLGDLDSTLAEASGVELAPPSDTSEGPLVTPAPTGAGEDPMSVTAPTGEDTSMVVGELAAEDPAVSVGPSQVAE